MHNKLILVGGGGHCKSVLDTIYAAGKYSEIVITDAEIPGGSDIMGCRVAGTDKELPGLYEKGFRHAFITIGSIKDTAVRQKAYEKAKKIGFVFPDIIDPSAVVAPSSRIGRGVFIGKNAVVNADAVIGDMAIINTAAVVEHDCRVGGFSHISVGAVLCGGVETGDAVFAGANATIIQGVKIGMNSVIGAGSIILSDVPGNSTVVGTWRI